MSFPRYPAYKPSGVEWLGEVPEHWGVLQSRRMFKARREAAKEGAIMLTASQKYGMISQAEFVEREGRRVVEVIQGKDNLIKVEPGDLVISMRSFQGGLEWCRLSGSTSFHYVPVTPIKHVVPSFFAHLMKSDRYISALRATTNLIRDGQEIRYSNFVQVPLPIIPESEQIAISSFLDRETAKIDALIAEQQRLIELLQEKRQAVISDAVTKGLNPNAPMKDSGVEWLGEVPEHWEVKKLRYVCKIQTGSRDTEEAVEDGEYSFFVRSQTVERINSYSYDCEAVLTAGDGAGVGKVFHYYTGPFDFHQRVYMLNDFNGIHGKLIYHFLKTNFFKVALQGGAKSTVDSLRRPMFTGFPVCIPPKDEQGALLEHVETEEEKIGKLMETSEKAVSLLQERRSALISAAVTGQIDVRGLAEAEAGEQ